MMGPPIIFICERCGERIECERDQIVPVVIAALTTAQYKHWKEHEIKVSGDACLCAECWKSFSEWFKRIRADAQVREGKDGPEIVR